MPRSYFRCRLNRTAKVDIGNVVEEKDCPHNTPKFAEGEVQFFWREYVASRRRIIERLMRCAQRAGRSAGFLSSTTSTDLTGIRADVQMRNDPQVLIQNGRHPEFPARKMLLSVAKAMFLLFAVRRYSVVFTLPRSSQI